MRVKQSMGEHREGGGKEGGRKPSENAHNKVVQCNPVTIPQNRSIMNVTRWLHSSKKKRSKEISHQLLLLVMD